MEGSGGLLRGRGCEVHCDPPLPPEGPPKYIDSRLSSGQTDHMLLSQDNRASPSMDVLDWLRG